VEWKPALLVLTNEVATLQGVLKSVQMQIDAISQRCALDRRRGTPGSGPAACP
jgi:hypothetical protein